MSRVFLLTVSVSRFPLGEVGLSLPLVESYALGLVAVWLSSAASAALVVAGALVVELVDTVVAVAAPVQVETVSPLHQPDLDLFPMVLVLPQVSRVVYHLLRGLYHLVLGLVLAQECCLVLGLAPPSAELHPGSPLAESCLAPPAAEFGLDHPSVESCSVHSTWLPFCFSSPSWASLAWGLSWVLGSSPALPSWVSSRVAAPWIHLLRHQVWVLGISLIMPLGHQACPDPPPALKIHRGRLCISGSPFDGLAVRIVFVIVWEHGCVVVEAMLLPEVVDKLVDHTVSPLPTNQGSLHPGSHAIVGEPFYEASCQMNL